MSHAHLDHAGRHEETIFTKATRRLMRARLGGRGKEHCLDYGVSRDFESDRGPFRLTLLPAGHVLGSAMALVEWEGRSLLYTGDFKLGASRTAVACRTARAEVLVMETTFGMPSYVFPPRDRVLGEVAQFCRQALETGQTPVLFCYSLGKAQEVLAGLQGLGEPIALESGAFRMARLYEEFGAVFPPYVEWKGENGRGRVTICPPGADRSRLSATLGPVQTAAVSGWAVSPRARYQWRVDAAFPLSDHADFNELLQFVEQTRPERIYTIHGFAKEFAQTLRQRGWDAAALGETEQMEFSLGLA